ncbi:hypothetical protein QPK87_08830 [Kamptonema cortianum]|nr:hypothetical protein [Kamptonema cortianum]
MMILEFGLQRKYEDVDQQNSVVKTKKWLFVEEEPFFKRDCLGAV